MATDWNEVGERFSSLGRTLHGRWNAGYDAGRPGSATTPDDSSEDVRSALDRVNRSLDGLADAITRTVNDPEVHQAATSAAGGLIEALGSSLDDLATRVQSTRRDDVAPGPDGSKGDSGERQV